MEAQPLPFTPPAANPDPRNHAKPHTPCRRKPLPSWRFGLSPVMRRFAIPDDLSTPCRPVQGSGGSYRLSSRRPLQGSPGRPRAGGRPWRDVISSEAVLGRLEAIKRPGREVPTFRRLAMRYRPSQAVRRFDRQTRRWIAGGISAPRGWFPAGRPRDWPGRLVRVTRRDPRQPRQWVGEYRRPCRQGRTEVGVAAPLDFAVGRLKPRPRSRGQFRRSVAFLLVTSLEYV